MVTEQLVLPWRQMTQSAAPLTQSLTATYTACQWQCYYQLTMTHHTANSTCILLTTSFTLYIVLSSSNELIECWCSFIHFIQWSFVILTTAQARIFREEWLLNDSFSLTIQSVMNLNDWRSIRRTIKDNQEDPPDLGVAGLRVEGFSSTKSEWNRLISCSIASYDIRVWNGWSYSTRSKTYWYCYSTWLVVYRPC